MSFKRLCAPALLAAAALGGCATVTDSNEQDMLVRAVIGEREVSGVACTLSNPAGRWFVVAPGRVTVRKSVEPLRIDCNKDGVGTAGGEVASHFAAANMVGNAVASAGLGYFIDRHYGSGFDYPLVLMVVLRGGAPAAADAAPAGFPANQVY
jgi:hypothetical protein